MSKGSFEIAGIKFTDVDMGGHGISTVKYPSQEEVAAYERGRADGRSEERADIVARIRRSSELNIKIADDPATRFSDSIGHRSLARISTKLADEIEAEPPAEPKDARSGSKGTPGWVGHGNAR